MDKSESIKNIAVALHNAQSEMSGAKKGSVNPHFGKSYADMGNVVEAIRVPFFDNGLSYSQFPTFSDGFVGVETILMHVSGEWISSVLLLPMKKQDPQAAGSAITYARRYALQSIAGIPSEDDDGNIASSAGKKPTGNNPADNTLIVKQYKSAGRDQQVAMWNKATPSQQTAITQAMSI